MRKLSQSIYNLISDAVNIHGTFDPSKIVYLFEEELTFKELDAVERFLQWCHNNNKPFGRANYNERYQEFLQSNAVSI